MTGRAVTRSPATILRLTRNSIPVGPHRTTEDFLTNNSAMSTADMVGLLIAALGGAAVGFERQWSGHAEGPRARFAGIRTFTLLGTVAGLSGDFITAGMVVTAGILLAGAVAIVAATSVVASMSLRLAAT